MYHSIKRTFPGLSVISEEHDTSTDDDADSLPKHDAEVDRSVWGGGGSMIQSKLVNGRSVKNNN